MCINIGKITQKMPNIKDQSLDGPPPQKLGKLVHPASSGPMVVAPVYIAYILLRRN